ncbi:hypothetical protein [Variovorax sp. OV700]|jgi:hypothetical protein|uniref:hypothetical protein n=1 Tax=Variovorax sp. OV700 TaxID=1882826 RepID=UPI000B810229|nr:hypothetical protein [Variovorax sp. OV700]
MLKSLSSIQAARSVHGLVIAFCEGGELSAIGIWASGTCQESRFGVTPCSQNSKPVFAKVEFRTNARHEIIRR